MSLTRIVPRWLPVLFVMSAIFWFSSQPSSALPNFGTFDWLIKKSGHVFEYALLTACFWFALDFRKDRRWLAWLLAVFYAVTDEAHQSFVPGRHPSIWDVLVFDNLGALVCLWITGKFSKQKRSAEQG